MLQGRFTFENHYVEYSVTVRSHLRTGLSSSNLQPLCYTRRVEDHLLSTEIIISNQMRAMNRLTENSYTHDNIPLVSIPLVVAQWLDGHHAGPLSWCSPVLEARVAGELEPSTHLHTSMGILTLRSCEPHCTVSLFDEPADP